MITEFRRLADIFEETVRISGSARKSANWMMGETMRLIKERELDADQVRFSPQHLAELIRAVEKGMVNNKTAKEIFEKIFDEDVEPIGYMKKHNLMMVEDKGLLEETADRILASNPKSIEEYLEGKEKVMGFFVGQMMKELKGKANPQSIQQVMKEKLEALKP